MQKFPLSLRALSICSPSIGCIARSDDVADINWNNSDCENGWLPDTSFIPKRQFRRLSRLSKMALYVAHYASEAAGDLKISAPIFCSRYGEIRHTYNVLKAIYDKDLVSPMDFSYSVHNTGQGLFSILQGDERPATVLSARYDALEQAMCKAWVQLQAGDEAVLVVYAEDVLPEVFDKLLETNVKPLAFALVVTKHTDIRPLSLSYQNASTSADRPRTYSNMHEASIVRMLVEQRGNVSNHNGRLEWLWNCG